MTIYYKIQKYLRIPIPLFVKKFFKKYYGKNNLDQQMEKYLNYNNGFYIELGAYDGITQSNTYYYEKNKNWKGLLIEPIEHVFKKCKKNREKGRRHRRKNRKENKDKVRRKNNHRPPHRLRHTRMMRHI